MAPAPPWRSHYGPTETHVVTAHRLFGPPDAWPERPPIGRPAPGARIRILDDRLGLLPPGAEGEICIGGESIATVCRPPRPHGRAIRLLVTAAGFRAPPHLRPPVPQWRHGPGALRQCDRVPRPTRRPGKDPAAGGREVQVCASVTCAMASTWEASKGQGVVPAEVGRDYFAKQVHASSGPDSSRRHADAPARPHGRPGASTMK
ncbi:AMP-binding protein [Streptomyces sp. NPDC050428]|uniref:AMP-binding protein n=1 Tax=Streptomyces sp. NPDC050428 TaxID=3155757 RepID=UPI00344029AE